MKTLGGSWFWKSAINPAVMLVLMQFRKCFICLEKFSSFIFLVAILWRDVFINKVPNGSYIFVSLFQNVSPGLVRVRPLKFLESHPCCALLFRKSDGSKSLWRHSLSRKKRISFIFIQFMEPKQFTALLLPLIHSHLLVSDQQYQELLASLHLFAGSLCAL